MNIKEAQAIQGKLIQNLALMGMFGAEHLLKEEIGKTKMTIQSGHQGLGRIEMFVNFIGSLDAAPPEDCQFNVGDRVVYTNLNGFETTHIVLGFDKDPANPKERVFLANWAYWLPVGDDTLRLA